MRKLVLSLAAIMAVALCVKFAPAAQSSESKPKHINGVLIDDHCAAKFAKESNPAKAAADHKAACALKCAKGGGEFVLLTSKKEMKLDKHGQELAMAYLSKADAKTHVRVTGEVEGDEIKVTNIEEAKPRKSSSSSSENSR